MAPGHDRHDESGDSRIWEDDQTHVDTTYARLDELRDHYQKRLTEVRRTAAGGTHQNRSERDAFAIHYETALARLDQVENRLVFGRLDMHSEPSRYIGRVGISDDAHNSLLIDWRAPASQPFYQATAAHPGDVRLRRHLMTRNRRIVGVEDELLDVTSPPSGLSGEGALFAAMAAARSGRMNDIVATIQAEQDRIIRSAHDQILIVSGGPGTGKTAVALHRAAYLLYAQRERLERSGVLVIGPSEMFLRYIGRVLPSLGETGVVSATLTELLGDVEIGSIDDEEVARIKGGPHLAQVLRRAVRSIPTPLTETRALDVDGERVLLHPEDVRQGQERARRSSRPHNLARKTYATTVMDAVVRRWAEHKGLDLDDEQGYLLQSLRESADARREINLRWMPTEPTALLRRLYAQPQRLVDAGLRADQARLLARDSSVGWSQADLPLLDELAVLLGDLERPEAERARRAREAERAAAVAYAEHAITADDLGSGIVSAELLASRFATSGPRASTAERALADREWTYGHIVVDEAQELSPMAWRALLRRCPSRSMTLVGDLDQRAGARRARSWREVLGKAASEHVSEAALTVNYRTPRQVMDAATAVLRHHGGGHAAPASSAREVHGSLVITATVPRRQDPRATPDAPGRGESLPADLAEIVTDELRRMGEGRLAVIAATGDLPAVRDCLTDIAIGEDLLDSPVVTLDPAAAKGLEFDVVVLVEPVRILAGGIGDLYVAMTRPTTRLHVVHAEALPEGFGASSDRAGLAAQNR